MMLAARTFNEVCYEVRLLGRRSGGRAGDLDVARLSAVASQRRDELPKRLLPCSLGRLCASPGVRSVLAAARGDCAMQRRVLLIQRERRHGRDVQQVWGHKEGAQLS